MRSNRLRGRLRATGTICSLAASVFIVAGPAYADIICQQISKKTGVIKVFYGVDECPNPPAPKPPKFKPISLEAIGIAGGLQGPQGPAGATGPAGPAGLKGDKGDKGDRGDPGVPGAVGATGPAGARGATGATGAAGAQGPQGVPGAQGAQGPAGQAGPQGPQGIPGLAGAQGPQGLKGATGATGPQGIPGESAYPGIAPFETTLTSGCKSFKDEIINLCSDDNGCTIYLRSIRGTDGQVRITRAHLFYAPFPGNVNQNSIPVTMLRDNGNEYPDILQVIAADTRIDKELVRHTVNNDGSGGVVNQVIHYYAGRCANEQWPPTQVISDRDRLYSLSFIVGTGWTTHLTIHDL